MAVVDAESLAMIAAEREKELRECEAVFAKACAAFWEACEAVLRIHDRQLYLATHPTFESYCRERLLMRRAHAYRLIAAARRIKLLPADSTIPKPANECQVRDFLKLPPDQFPGAWVKAVEKANGGQVTPAVIHDVIAELRPGEPNGKSNRGTRANGQTATRLQVHLDLARKAFQDGDMERGFAELDNIELVIAEMATGR